MSDSEYPKWMFWKQRDYDFPLRFRQMKLVYTEQMRMFKKSRLTYAYFALLAFIPIFGFTFLPIYYNEVSTTTSAVRFMMFFTPLSMSILAPRIVGKPQIDEYTGNTAYTTFTVPISRSTIYLGKYLAAYTLTIIFFICVYAVGITSAYAYQSHSVDDLLGSFILCLFGLFAVSGTAYGIGAYMNKGAGLLTSAATIAIPILFVLGLILANGSYMAALEYMMGGSWETMKMLPPFMGYTSMFHLCSDSVIAQFTSTFLVSSAPIYQLALISGTWGTAFLLLGLRKFRKKDL